MGCIQVLRLAVYVSLFVFVQSIPTDINYDGVRQQYATQSAYKSLLPPRWSQINPMKPTLPYTGGDHKKEHAYMDPTQANFKSSDRSDLPILEMTHYSGGHPQFFENEISDGKQNYANKNSVGGLLEAKDQKKQEKEEFIQFLRLILWDAEDDSEEHNESEGRQFNANYLTNNGGYYGTQSNIDRQQSLLRWHGILGRPMPQVLKKKGIAARVYEGFEDTCYSLACTFGINKVISQISRMFG